jgi:invasion protein IalB
MSDFKPVAALVLALLAGLPAAAQTAGQGTTPPAPETPAEAAPPAEATGGLSLGEAVDEEQPFGATYVAQEFGDWQMSCVKTESGADPCQLYQLLEDPQGNSIAEISMFGLPAGQEAAVGATIVTPLETLLPAQITLRVDSAQAKRYPFTFCAALGCVARVGFTADEVNAFRRGNTATMTIVPAAAPDQQVPITISLAGFTAGLAAVNEANAKADAAGSATVGGTGGAAP